ncbi:DUF262 domain-containing protein [Enterobacterales bacterium AE_CKDN230030158-1A_HGKHYDSX7]
MKIQCIDSDIRKVLESGIYTIPRFQRPFSWDKENIEEFWSDTTSDVKKDYFIGAIVTYTMGSASYGLVDGQQRLTTITISLCALRDKYLELGYSQPANGIHRLIQTHDLNNQAQFVLKTETSYPYLQAKIQSFQHDEEEIELGEEERAIGIAYETVSEYIKTGVSEASKGDPSKSKQQIKKWLDKIRDKFLALKVIWITLETQDDAYLIFETLNTRGKDLTSADLVKNHFLRLLPNKGKALDRPKDHWLDMQSHLEGAKKPIQMKTFLHHYWLSKYPFTTEKQLFKSIRNEVNASNIKEVMEELRSDCTLYRGISEPGGLELWSKATNDIQDSLHCISDILNIQIANPLLLTTLRLFKSKKLKDGQVREIFSLVEKYHFIYTSICALPSSGGVTQMYAVHARELANAKDSNTRGICIQDFKKKIKTKIPPKDIFSSKFKLLSYANARQRDIIRYTLWKILSTQASALSIDRTDASIEHLLPQSTNMSFSHSLGNLLIVPTRFNGKELGNKSFEDKRKTLIENGYPLDKDIKNAVSWNQTEIEQRLSNLADYAYDEVWKIK